MLTDPAKAGCADRMTTTIRTRTTSHGQMLLVVLAVCAVFVGTSQPTCRADDPTFAPLADWERQSLRSRIFLRPADARLLRAARSQAVDGQPRHAAVTLQKLLDAGDSFIVSDDGSSIQNARRFALELIQSNAKLSDDYEVTFGPSATGLFMHAVEASDEVQLRAIVRRYGLTSAGFKAAHRLAVLHFDRGEMETAYQLLTRLFHHPLHRDQFTANARLRLALCSSFTGRADEAKEHLAAVGEKDVRIAGRTIQAKWRFGPERASHTGRSSVGSIGGAPQSWTRSNPIPYLRPLWSRPLGGSPVVGRLIDHWERDRRFSNPQRSVAVPSFVVSTGDVSLAGDAGSFGEAVIVRDQHRLRAVRLQSGETLWTFKLTSAPREVIESQLQRGSTTTELLEQHGLLWNALLGMPAADQQRVYFIDGFDFSARNFSAFDVIKPPPTLVDAKRSYVMPSANRLVAIDLSHAARAANGEVELAWSTAGPSVSLEWFDQLDQQSDGVLEPAEMLDAIHDFNFYDANSDGRIERDEARRVLQQHGHDGPLAGHFFLGPPLPVDGRLFAVTERDGEINAVALDAGSGRVLWVQPVAQTNQTIGTDMRRATHPCVPAYVDGMVVLPTQLGVLVAVNALDGSLVWASPVPDHGPYPGMTSVPGFWASESEQATPLVVHVQGDRLIWMPPFSKWLFCLDVRTGRRLWKAERDGDEQIVGGANRDKFVGAVVDGVVLLVGSRECRGLSLATGDRLWKSQTGTSSGRGVAFTRPSPGSSNGVPPQSCYLLPIQAGAVIALDVRSGRILATSGERLDVQQSPLDELTATLPGVPGNLLATRSHIVSVGPRGITAYARAADLQAMALKRWEFGPMPIGNVMLVGELSEALGNDTDAIHHYESVRRTSSDAATETRLRNLLFARAVRELDTDSLTRLRSLCRNQRDRIRLLTLEAEAALRGSDVAALQDVVRSIRTLDIREPISLGNNASHRVSAETWIRQLWRRARTEFNSPALLQVQSKLESIIDEFGQAANQPNRGAEHRLLRQLVSDFADWPIMDEARLFLAEHAAERGEYHAAEMLCSSCLTSTNPLVHTPARRQLARLWDRLGLHIEAADLMATHAAKHPVHVWKQFLEELHPLTHEALNQLAIDPSLSRSESRVGIQSHLWLRDDPRVIESYTGYRGRYRLPWGNTFRLLDKGTDTESRFEVIDRQSGMAVNHINVPARRSLPSVSRGSHVGHSLTVGGMGRVLGVSLLDRERHDPVWSRELLDLPGPARLVMPGPAGPRFCSVQTQGTLAVLDPIDGQVLWQRDDLTMASGLISDPSIGMLGDEHVLVVLDGGGRGYTSYRTADGNLLARGQLPIKPRTIRFKLGRRLFYVAESPAGDCYRLWDPLTNTNDIDDLAFQPTDGRYLATTTPADEIAYVTADGRLIIYNADEQRRVVDFELSDCGEPSAKMITGLRVFHQAGNHIVNLQSTNNVLAPGLSTYYATNNFMPSVHVQGELLAINAQTGRRIWRQSVPCLSVLDPKHARLPFLIAFTRVSDQTEAGKTRQSTMVTTIDTTSGEVIATRAGLFPDRILHFSYEPKHRRIDFHGVHGRLRITY